MAPDPPDRRPLILGASRRTDLVGWYPARLVQRLRERVRRMRRYELYGLVLWTKRPAALLQHAGLARLADEVGNLVLQLTITGLGGSRIEPGVPPTADILRLLPALVAGPLRGQPARLRWRCDPVWPRVDLLDDFQRIADACARVGATSCTLSFPTRFCQLGPMADCYRRHGLPVPGVAERRELLARLHEAARPRGLRLLVCAQPETLALLPPGVLEPAQCVPREVLEGLHPAGRRFPAADHDRSQRQACTCLPSEDLGSYEADPCGSGCLYCYSRAGGEAGRRRWEARPGDYSSGKAAETGSGEVET
ncbi:MAG: DUF1848 family protein [Myxococcota bacterium]|jgi:hypothetical protein|nr:DUF1848 family protein [Myxococcota bacterium]